MSFLPRRWTVIAWQGIQLLLRRKGLIALILLAFVPFLVRSVLVYLATVLGAVRFLTVDASFFHGFLSQQLFFSVLVSVYAGSGLISQDLAANALQIYFSKPITRMDYLLGKLGTLFFFLALTTLVPGLLLFVLAAICHPTLDWLRQSYWIAGSILLHALLIMATHGLVMIAFSSLTESRRFAGLCFAALFFLSDGMAALMGVLLQDRSIAWVSPTSNLRQAGSFCFALELAHPYPVWISWLVLGILTVGGGMLAYRRIVAVEVVR